MSSYFLNQQISHGQGYRNLKAYRHLNQQQGRHALLTVGNCLQLYKILTDGLALQASFEFACNIIKIQVIPSSEHSSDYVWILDELGRFGLWHPERGLQMVSNHILSDSYYQALSYNQNNLDVTSGIHCQIRQRETIGYIFFTIERSLVFIEIAVKKEGPILAKVWQEKINTQYRIRFLNWLTNTIANLFLGVVVEQDTGSTALEVYQFTEGQDCLDSKPVWILSKKNMLHFRSASNGDLLIVTYDEVALHRFKQNNPIKCYRTKGNFGQGFCLGDGFYGHLGRQLVIFSKDELKPFNEFKFPEETVFEGGGFVESSCLGSMESGCLIVGIITHRSQVYLLRIMQKKCSVLKHNFGLFSVSGIQAIENHRHIFAMITTAKSDCHQVLLSHRIHSTQIEKEQQLPAKVDSLAVTLRGGFVIMGIGFKNYVLRMTKNQDYQFYFDLPQGQFIIASDNLLVLHNGIYQIDYQTQTAQKHMEDEVLLAQVIEQICYYLNSEGNIQMWDTSHKQTSLLAEEHILDYCWGKTLKTYSLISANSGTPKEVKLISQQGTSIIPIKGHTLISSLSCVAVKGRKQGPRLGNQASEQILIGYADGTIHVQSVSGHVIQSFQLLHSNYVIFQRVRQDQLLLISGSHQYLLVHSPQGTSLQQIQLSVQGSSVSNLAYLSKCNKLIYIQQGDDNQLLLQSSLSFQNQITKILPIHQSESLPFIKTKKGSIFIANNRSIACYSLRAGKIVKQTQIGFNEINGLEDVQMGLIVVGIDYNSNAAALICNQELQIIYTFKIDVKKSIKAVKVIKGTNDFFIWSETDVSLHRIDTTGHVRLLFGSQLQLQTHAVSLDIESNLFLVNDPDRYLSVYNYHLNINHVADLLPAYTITASAFIGKNILISDQRGCLNLFQIDRQHSFINRSIFVKQGTVNIGQTIQAVHQTEQVLYYVTSDCCIYQLHLIEKQEFDLLHRLEENILNLQSKQSMFSYYKWRSKVQCDKIIDGGYLSMVLKDPKHPIRSEFQVKKYQEVIAKFSP